MMTYNEEQAALRYRQISEPHLARVIGSQSIPWAGWNGPSELRAWYGVEAPVYVLQLDPNRINAGKILADRHLVHNISTALESRVGVQLENTYGLAIRFDERGLVLPDLLEKIEGECMFLTGPRGTSKTTILHHRLAKVIAQGIDPVIIDLKSQVPGKWLGRPAIGAGGNAEVVAMAIDSLLAEMNDRNALSPKMVIFVDELIRLNHMLPGYPAKILDILAFGRESNMDVIVASQSEQAGPNGFEGMMDLKAGFLHVRTSRNGQVYRVTVEEDGKIVEYKTPGPFRIEGVFDVLKNDIELTSEEIELVRYAMIVEPVGSFALASKMYKMIGKHGWNEYTIRTKAREWEKAGLLTYGDDDQKGKIARKVTPKLARLAGLEGDSGSL